MFASRVTGKVTIGDVVITIQKLSKGSLEKAAEKVFDRALALRAKLSGSDQAAADRAADQQPQRAAQLTVEQRRKLRYQQFDWRTVLQAGIRGWTLEDKAVTPAAIEDLEPEVADQLHEAILDLSLPPIDPATEIEVQKNV